MARQFTTGADRILIYRLGSIGDFVISLPALQLVRQRFPDADIRLLTNHPVDARAAPAMSVLAGSGLINGTIVYSVGTRDPRALLAVMREIRSFNPDLLVYLVPYRGLLPVIRDMLFFRWCGVSRMFGIPLRSELRRVRPPPDGSDLCEREAQRLGRCLSELGDAGAEQLEHYDLRLSEAELAEADRHLATIGINARGDRRFIGMSIGTKQILNNWGDDNWRAVVEALDLPDLALVLVGSAEEKQRSQDIARRWPGTVLNLCGIVSPRVSAAAMRRAELFLCHDSGPMHLTAAVGTKCVAVFSGKDPPGMWFPVGSRHTILYPPHGATSIHAIRPLEVIDAVKTALAMKVIGAGDREGGPQRCRSWRL